VLQGKDATTVATHEVSACLRRKKGKKEISQQQGKGWEVGKKKKKKVLAKSQNREIVFRGRKKGVAGKKKGGGRLQRKGDGNRRGTGKLSRERMGVAIKRAGRRRNKEAGGHRGKKEKIPVATKEAPRGDAGTQKIEKKVPAR